MRALRGTSISLFTLLLIFVRDSLSLDVEPSYRSLDLALGGRSVVAVTDYNNGGPTAEEKYRHRYRRQAGTTPGTPAASNTPPSPLAPPIPGFGLPSSTPVETFNVTDDHAYYNSTFYSHGTDYFFDLDAGNRTVVIHTALSSSHLTAGEVVLPFQFPFYGHTIGRVYIATGGFLSLSTFFHQYLSATQYIAPLMGNFDPSLNGSSRIRYAHNATSFTVEWDDIHVRHIQDVGRFTFQTTLFSDGRIVFAYKTIPEDVNNIGGGNGHKVTIGLSDGYYIDEALYPGSYLVKRTIYHYHNVYLNKTLVRNNSAYLLHPLKTCNVLHSCSECLGQRAEIQFDCGWCGTLERCSDGLDRHRQEWVDKGCPEDAQEECSNHDSAATVAIVLIVIIIVVVLLMVSGCLVYAYKNPSSRSGQHLITFQQHVRRGVRRNPRRNPQDNYGESIVGNMQEAKPTPPPAYTPPSPHDTTPTIPTIPTIPTPPLAAAATATATSPSDVPVVITAGGAPGAQMTGNGDAIPPKPGAAVVDVGDIGKDPSASMSDC